MYDNLFKKNPSQIERVQNPILWMDYEARKTTLEQANQSTEIERRLWHGTSLKDFPNINTGGFNRAYCSKNGEQTGRGIPCCSGLQLFCLVSRQDAENV